jgi:hypothetical protein
MFNFFNKKLPTDFDQVKDKGREIGEIFFKPTQELQQDFNLIDKVNKSKFEDFQVSSFASFFEKLELIPTVDLGDVNLKIRTTNPSAPIDADLCQVWMRRTYTNPTTGQTTEQWINWVPNDDAAKKYFKFSLFSGETQTFNFDISTFDVGKYDSFRFIFFTNHWDVLADQSAEDVSFEILTKQKRVKTPYVEILADKIQDPGADGKLHIPYVIKMPAKTFTTWGGWFLLAKGSSMFQQPWIAYARKDGANVLPDGATKVADGPDPYWYSEGEIVFDYPAVSGIHNLQFGLFDYNWKMQNWVWPGINVQVGGDSWVTKCPESKLPPRLRVIDGKLVKLSGTGGTVGTVYTPYNIYEGTTGANAITAIRGGNYGNQYLWSEAPDYNRTGYFSSLKFLGHKFLRLLFNPDKYIADNIYRNRIQDTIGKMLTAGCHVIAGPQHIPTGNDLYEKSEAFYKLVELMANNWKGLPVWVSITNEPNDIGDWNLCKPILEKAATIYRSIDANAFIICPTSKWSKENTTPEANNLINPGLVDAYAYHAYNNANEVFPNLKPILDTGVAVIVEEYGCGDVEWQKGINIEMEKISKLYPNLIAFATWAWTRAGEDACPMVEDGNLANVKLTATGQMQAKDMKTWDSGNFINVENVVQPTLQPTPQPQPQPTPQPAPAPQPVPKLVDTYTKLEVDDLFNAKLADSLALLNEDFKLYVKTSLENYDVIQDEETKQFFETAVGNLELVDVAEIDAKYTDVSEVSALSGKEIAKFRADLYNKALSDYKLMLKAPTVAKLSAYLAKFIEYIKPV